MRDEYPEQGTGRKDFLRHSGFLVLALAFICCILPAGCSRSTVTTKQSGSFQKISSNDLLLKIDRTDWVIVDIRPKASFNGWQLFGETAKGHIKGAVSYPLDWIQSASNSELKKKLVADGITMPKSVVLYHATAAECRLAAARLGALGYPKIFIYENFSEWTSDPRYPMEFLPNYEKLVHAGWVNDLITGKAPLTKQGRRYLILEVAWGPPDAYDLGHIPGAIHLDTDEIESLPTWKFRSDDQIESVLKKIGITKDTLIIVYSTEASPAARTLICLMRAGVDDVRLLDGGWQAWTSSRHAIETRANNRIPVVNIGLKIPSHSEYIVDTAQVKHLLQQSNVRLVSIRKWEEFIGKISGYSYIEPKGSVPGSIWGHPNTDLRDQDGRMADYTKIAALWQEWDIRPDKKVVFYCGTGWRASEAWFYAYLMGWKDIAVYDSGWMDWSIDPANPIQTGDPRTANTYGQTRLGK